MKDNITPIGSTSVDVPVYAYNYKGDDQVHVGVMSDEVPQSMVRQASIWVRYGRLFGDFGMSWLGKYAEPLSIGLMGLGELVNAQNAGRQANLAPYMGMVQQAGQRRKMQGLRSKLMQSGILGSMTPDQQELMGGILDIDPQAGMGLLVDHAFPKPSQMTDQQRLFQLN